MAIFLGLFAAIAVSYIYNAPGTEAYLLIPIAVVVGLVAITFTGLADDVWGWHPRLKVAGQLVAAAALAIEDVGVRLAEGLLTPLVGGADDVILTLGSYDVVWGHVFYWLGTVIIAVFVLGGCNATNLLDGLDGLLSGIVGIVALGLLVICLMMAINENSDAERTKDRAYELAKLIEDELETSPSLPEQAGPINVKDYLSGQHPLPPYWVLVYYPADERDEFGSLDVAVERRTLAGARIALCIALFGAVLGFLPFNFNPASIFLGDCGSLLLGYMSVVIILMLGDLGETHLVLAGLIIFSVPIMDTVLAIIRRRLTRQPMSVPDDQHIHHMLKRSLGGVKPAVFALYGIGVVFAVIGVSLAILSIDHTLRLRVIYSIALVLYAIMGVIIGLLAVKSARKQLAAASPTRAQPVASSDTSGGGAAAVADEKGRAADPAERRPAPSKDASS
jgi:UDP-N-acetylmuramyl pentapeptide phosphotransferase/UDP-N-acetylglucosamine-1-phosphate transferase